MGRQTNRLVSSRVMLVVVMQVYVLEGASVVSVSSRLRTVASVGRETVAGESSSRRVTSGLMSTMSVTGSVSGRLVSS